MKRLKLEDFKAKKLTNQADETTESKVDQLLGQVLGDCHDDDTDNNNGDGNNINLECMICQ